MGGPRPGVQPELPIYGVEQLQGKGCVREFTGLNCHIICVFIL
jgi:hypothetical protein